MLLITCFIFMFLFLFHFSRNKMSNIEEIYPRTFCGLKTDCFQIIVITVGSLIAIGGAIMQQYGESIVSQCGLGLSILGICIGFIGSLFGFFKKSNLTKWFDSNKCSGCGNVKRGRSNNSGREFCGCDPT